MGTKPTPSSPEVRWASQVGWQPSGPLDWAGVGGEHAWTADEDKGTLQGPAHRPLLPPTTAGALADTSEAPGGGPNAHDAMELALAGPAWLVHTRDLLFSPWSPLPRALAAVAEAHGVGPEVHGLDPELLRLLAWRLPSWFAARGTPDAAKNLLSLLAVWCDARCPEDSPHRRSIQRAATEMGQCLAAVGSVPRDEVLAARPERWWRARRATAAPLYRVQAGAVLFQPDSGGFPVRHSDLVLPLQRQALPPPQVGRLLPPWVMPRHVLAPERLPARTPMPQEANSRVLFQPSEGSLIDLDSLKAINVVSEDLWRAIEPLVADREEGAASAGLILNGLRLEGIPSGTGPPGAFEPRLARRGDAVGLLVGEGRALVRHVGRALTLDVEAQDFVPLPKTWSSGQAEGVVLVLDIRIGQEDWSSPLVAREKLIGALRIIPSSEHQPDTQLPVARSMPSSRRWETDLAALWSPDDPRNRRLIEQLNEIGDTVWRAAPKGLTWDQALLGRDWLRYQCAAAAALQAAGLALETRPMSTASRVRLLEGLYRRLRQSVAEAAEATWRLFGPTKAEGPYGGALKRLGLSVTTERS